MSVPVTVSTICRISFVCAQARIEAEKRRAIGADDLTGIAHLEVDAWVILRRFFPNALELPAANTHHWPPPFIIKRWITFHLHPPPSLKPPIPAAQCPPPTIAHLP